MKTNHKYRDDVFEDYSGPNSGHKFCICGKEIIQNRVACPECLIDMDAVADLLELTPANRANHES